MKNLNCLVKLGVAGIVSILLTLFIPACESGIEESTKPAPAFEVQMSAPEGVVTVGTVVQVEPKFCAPDPSLSEELRRQLEKCLGVQQ